MAREPYIFLDISLKEVRLLSFWNICTLIENNQSEALREALQDLKLRRIALDYIDELINRRNVFFNPTLCTIIMQLLNKFSANKTFVIKSIVIENLLKLDVCSLQKISEILESYDIKLQLDSFAFVNYTREKFQIQNIAYKLIFLSIFGDSIEIIQRTLSPLILLDPLNAKLENYSLINFLIKKLVYLKYNFNTTDQYNNTFLDYTHILPPNLALEYVRLILNSSNISASCVAQFCYVILEMQYTNTYRIKYNQLNNNYKNLTLLTHHELYNQILAEAVQYLIRHDSINILFRVSYTSINEINSEIVGYVYATKILGNINCRKNFLHEQHLSLLHSAVKLGASHLLEMLLKENIDFTLKDSLKYSLLDYLRSYPYKRTIRTLSKHTHILKLILSLNDNKPELYTPSFRKQIKLLRYLLPYKSSLLPFIISPLPILEGPYTTVDFFEYCRLVIEWQGNINTRLIKNQTLLQFICEHVSKYHYDMYGTSLKACHDIIALLLKEGAMPLGLEYFISEEQKHNNNIIEDILIPTTDDLICTTNNISKENIIAKNRPSLILKHIRSKLEFFIQAKITSYYTGFKKHIYRLVTLSKGDLRDNPILGQPPYDLPLELWAHILMFNHWLDFSNDCTELNQVINSSDASVKTKQAYTNVVEDSFCPSLINSRISKIIEDMIIEMHKKKWNSLEKILRQNATPNQTPDQYSKKVSQAADNINANPKSRVFLYSP